MIILFEDTGKHFIIDGLAYANGELAVTVPVGIETQLQNYLTSESITFIVTDQTSRFTRLQFSVQQLPFSVLDNTGDVNEVFSRLR